MIADTRKDKLTLQADAIKDIKNNIHSSTNQLTKTDELIKPGQNKKIKDKNEVKNKVAKESVPLKHQSKKVSNTANRSQLDHFTQKSSNKNNN